MNRRTFLKTTGAAAACVCATPAWSASKPAVPLSDDEILAEARRRIPVQRQADGVISVRDGAGKPVAGARITVEQLRHQFRFGCNFFKFAWCGDPESEGAYRQRFAALFNFCTLGFYWGGYEAQRGRPNYAYTDQAVEWTSQHGITCKGHPLVWDNAASSPRWLPDDTKEIRALSQARVREIVGRFRGRIDIWDVVNEPTHLADKVFKSKMAQMAATLGAADYVNENLRIARAANPDAFLLVNDYRTDPPYLEILKRQREDGKFLLNAVGIQSHMHSGVWPLAKAWEICDTYAQLGLPLHFTETTILSGSRKPGGPGWSTTTAPGEAQQAEQTARLYTALFGHPAVEAITWWDFSDRGAWQEAPAGWVRDDMSPKPVYERMLSLVKGEWWTKTEARTDEHGNASVRAFCGRYRLTAEIPGTAAVSREVEWKREANRFDLAPKKES